MNTIFVCNKALEDSYLYLVKTNLKQKKIFKLHILDKLSSN